MAETVKNVATIAKKEEADPWDEIEQFEEVYDD